MPRPTASCKDLGPLLQASALSETTPKTWQMNTRGLGFSRLGLGKEDRAFQRKKGKEKGEGTLSDKNNKIQSSFASRACALSAFLSHTYSSTSMQISLAFASLPQLWAQEWIVINPVLSSIPLSLTQTTIFWFTGNES